MSLNTPEEFKAEFADSGYARTADIDRALASAYDKLIDYVGEGVVTDAASANTTEVRRARRLKRAEGNLAFAELAPRIGSRLREAGIISEEQPIMDDKVVKYLDPAKVRLIVADNKAEAMEELNAYLVPAVEASSISTIPVYRV